MAHRRDDVVRRALDVLDTWGLPDLTMRRLAGELGVQPSALYHHVADKQTLLGLVADEILARGARPAPVGESWDRVVAARCTELREAVLAYRDGAEVVATARAFGLGAGRVERDLVVALTDAGLGPALERTAARTLVHFVLGHASDEQTHLQAGSAGALPAGSDPRATDRTDGTDGPRAGSDFVAGLELVLDGIRQRVAARAG